MGIFFSGQVILNCNQFTRTAASTFVTTSSNQSTINQSITFYLYSSISQITHLSQGTSQFVQNTTPSVLRSSHRTRKNSQRNPTLNGKPELALTIGFIKKESIKHTLKSGEDVCLINTNWKLFPQNSVVALHFPPLLRVWADSWMPYSCEMWGIEFCFLVYFFKIIVI